MASVQSSLIKYLRVWGRHGSISRRKSRLRARFWILKRRNTSTFNSFISGTTQKYCRNKLSRFASHFTIPAKRLSCNAFPGFNKMFHVEHFALDLCGTSIPARQLLTLCAGRARSNGGVFPSESCSDGARTRCVYDEVRAGQPAIYAMNQG